MKAFACAAHPKVKDVFDLATPTGLDPIANSDMSKELQALSAQLYHVLVMMLNDQALETVRNSPEGVEAEVWRELLCEYELGVCMRYGAMSQSLKRFGAHDETGLAREIEFFERDVSKHEQPSSDLISDTIERGIVCGGMAYEGMKQHIDLGISRVSTYNALRDEIINYSQARRTWTDPNAMQVDAVHLGAGGQHPPGGRGSGPPNKDKKGHNKSECRKMQADSAAGRCHKNGKAVSVNALTTTGGGSPLPTQTSYAPSMARSLASTVAVHQMVSVCFTSPLGNQQVQQPEPWFINMTGPTQPVLMAASLDGTDHALLDSGSGLTSCPLNCSDDLSLLPTPDNLPTLSNAPEEAWNALVCVVLAIAWRTVSPWW